jgi:hypothetical protein
VITEFSLQCKERIAASTGESDARPGANAGASDRSAYTGTRAGDKHMPVIEPLLGHVLQASTRPRTGCGTGKIGFILQLGGMILLRPSHRFQTDLGRFV